MKFRIDRRIRWKCPDCKCATGGNITPYGEIEFEHQFIRKPSRVGCGNSLCGSLYGEIVLNATPEHPWYAPAGITNILPLKKSYP